MWSNVVCFSWFEGNDGEEESEEDEDYIPTEDWKKVADFSQEKDVC